MIFKNVTIENLAAELPKHKDTPEVITLLEDIEKYAAIGMTKVSEQLTKQAAACVIEKMGFGLLAVEDLAASTLGIYINSAGEKIGYTRHEYNSPTYIIHHIRGDGKIDKLTPPRSSQGAWTPPWDSISLKKYDGLIPHEILSKIEVDDADDLVIFKPFQNVLWDPILATPLHTPQYVAICKEDTYEFEDMSKVRRLSKLIGKTLFIKSSAPKLKKSNWRAHVLGKTRVERTRYYAMLYRWD
jgi:hypothetical protein